MKFMENEIMNINLIPILENETLLLRPWVKEFAEDYFRINSNHNVTDAACVKTILTIADAKAKIKSFEKSKRTEWSIAIKNEGKPIIVGGIGICEVISIKEYANVKELGYGIDEKYWGNGIMPKAVALVEKYCFEALGSEAVIIRIVSGNRQSERVAEKCGYKYHSKKKIGSYYKINYIKLKNDN